MDEASALNVTAARAFESAEPVRALWSDADRAWASRAAAEVVGAQGTIDAYLARRAAFALERLGEREPAFKRAVVALHWRPWVGGAIIGLAFAVGLFLDQVGAAQRINLLDPPVLVLILWNLVMYAVIVAGHVVRFGAAAGPGPLRSLLTRIAGGAARARGGDGARQAIAAFGADWSRRAGPLYAVRAARILHLAAAALAAGVLAGLYLRGIAFEYRASWESTFLEPSTVRSLTALFYAPGSWATGIPVPPVEEVAVIRAPAGENAARWVHLMAATVAIVVLLPRLTLALLAWLVERYRATHFAFAGEDAYVRRLLRGFRGGAARVRVFPYSYAPSAPAVAGLEQVIARSFGGSAAMVVAPPADWGADLGSEPAGVAGSTLVALFNATATPEREVHGVFLAALARQRAAAEAVFALIDESTWNAHYGADAARTAERRAAWSAVCADAGVPVIFADLASPDLATTDAALDAAIGERNA
ncbi:MAG: DUF2868 domain-containing protein [Gammaproteobacteria bacterium]|nr:DUF2868 domain-containing protein [Gammaproteobacteria bacterium]